MQRKPGFPIATCNIKMPDGAPSLDPPVLDEDGEQLQRRQQLINFGHAQWGFNNWSWSVTKQDLDFVDFSNGKYCAGVVAFVSITVKSFDIHRENIGYATSLAPNKGSAIYKSRKCAVTNALRETLLSFGGNVATELMELLESHKSDFGNPIAAPEAENNQNLVNKPPEPKNKHLVSPSEGAPAVMSVRPGPPAVKNAGPPPVAAALPMPANAPRPLAANAPRAPAAPAPHVRPNSNEGKPLEAMGEEEARAERKRRQRQAQEEFRLKQMMKQKPGQESSDEKQELIKNSSGFDQLVDIPTQDIVIEETGAEGKRRSPGPDGASKRRSVMSRLDILTD